MIISEFELSKQSTSVIREIYKDRIGYLKTQTTFGVFDKVKREQKISILNRRNNRHKRDLKDNKITF